MKTVTPLGLQKALKKKYPLYTFTLKQLLKYNLHLGTYKNKRNPLNNDLVFTTKKNIDIINLLKAIFILRLILPIITDIISKGGSILTVSPSYITRERYLLRVFSEETKQNFFSYWNPGMLSNFKEIKRQEIELLQQKKFTLNYVPNFIIFLTSEHNVELKTEVLRFKVPCAIIQALNKDNLKFLYQIPMPMHLERYYIKYFLCQLIATSILLGYNKRILSFTIQKFKYVKPLTPLKAKTLEFFKNLKKKPEPLPLESQLLSVQQLTRAEEEKIEERKRNLLNKK